MRLGWEVACKQVRPNPTDTYLLQVSECTVLDVSY